VQAKNILIIEDERPIAMLLSTIVRGMGHETVVAADGAAGLTAAINQKPDLVLLDMILPIMSGWEFLKAIKQNPHLEDVPVVLVSTVDRVDQELRGQYHLVVKPFSPATVREAVTRALSGEFAAPAAPSPSDDGG
jgi:twitching motility two-component system response regulator PilH